MSMSLREALEIDILREFKVVAGFGGLERKMSRVAILDYEFVQGASYDRKEIFEPESLLISTLLFAKDDEDLLLDSVEKLIKMEQVGLAYKKVIFNELPEKVIELANANNFPIVAFGGDEYFEDIIFKLTLKLQRKTNFEEIDEGIEALIDGKLSKEQRMLFAEKIGEGLSKRVKAYCMAISNEEKAQKTFNSIRQLMMAGAFKSKTIVSRYKENIIVVVSHFEVDDKRMNAIFGDILYLLGLNDEDVVIGESDINRLDCLDVVLREAYHAEMIADVEDCQSMSYSDIGLYKVIIKKELRSAFREYMKCYLAPITNSTEFNSQELLTTAKEYVLACGNMDVVAAKMFCHKNTVRYRIGKLHEKLNPRGKEAAFIEELSIAIKIYITEKYFE